MWPHHRLAAEAAADEVRDHPHVADRDPEQRRDGELAGTYTHGGVVEREPVTVPTAVVADGSRVLWWLAANR